MATALGSSAFRAEIVKAGRRAVEVVDVDLGRCRERYGVGGCTAGRDHVDVPQGFSTNTLFSCFAQLKAAASATTNYYQAMSFILMDVLHTGTVAGGTSTTVTLAAGASAVDDAYNGCIVQLSDGQERFVTGYVGATKVATLSREWDTTPTTETYKVLDAPNAQERLITAYNGTTKYATIQPGLDSVPGTPGDTVYYVVDRRSACYNTWRTCAQRESYLQGVQTWRFTTRTAPPEVFSGGVDPIRADGEAPPDEIMALPYLTSAPNLATTIDRRKGLSPRGSITLQFADEPVHVDHFDLYRAQRGVIENGTFSARGVLLTGGTFWATLIKRYVTFESRAVRVRRGYAASPWDWDTVLSEHYVAMGWAGPTLDGTFSLTIKDKLAIPVKTKVPLPVAAQLGEDFLATDDAGTAQAGGASTITLQAEASVTDDYYNGMNVRIVSGLGQGQEREITDYVGATKVATVDSPWDTVPGTGNTYEVGKVQVSVESGGGEAFDEYGTPIYCRIGDELVEFASRSGDTFTLGSLTKRAVFGSTREDHDSGDSLELARRVTESDYADLLVHLLTDAGVAAGDIDTASIEAAVDVWLSTSAYAVDDLIGEPEEFEKLMGGYLVRVGAVMWSDPWAGKIKGTIIGPTVPDTDIPAYTDDDFLDIKVEPLHDARITRAAFRYALRDSSSDRDEARNFGRAAVTVDLDAESALEYNQATPRERFCPGWTSANDEAAAEASQREVAWHRDGPWKVRFRIDPWRWEFSIADQIFVTTRLLVEADGSAALTRLVVTSLKNEGTHIEVEGETVDAFSLRYLFIAPDTTGEYPDDIEWGHVSEDGGANFFDGGEPYLIV